MNDPLTDSAWSADFRTCVSPPPPNSRLSRSARRALLNRNSAGVSVDNFEKREKSRRRIPALRGNAAQGGGRD